MGERESIEVLEGVREFIGSALARVAQNANGEKAGMIGTAEAARLTGMSDNWIRGSIAAGTLRAARFGRTWRIARSDLDLFVLAAQRRDGPRRVELPADEVRRVAGGR